MKPITGCVYCKINLLGIVLMSICMSDFSSFHFLNFCTSAPYLKFLSLVDIIKGRIYPLSSKFSLLYLLSHEKSFADLPDFLRKIISAPSKESKNYF